MAPLVPFQVAFVTPDVDRLLDPSTEPVCLPVKNFNIAAIDVMTSFLVVANRRVFSVGSEMFCYLSVQLSRGFTNVSGVAVSRFIIFTIFGLRIVVLIRKCPV